MASCILLVITLLLQRLTPALGVHEVKAGVIMVEKSVLPFKMEMVGPALDIALETAEWQYGVRFLKHVRLYPDFCNSVYSVGAVSDLYHNDHVDVLIGPGCSGDITVCGKLATHYKLPLVSGVGDLVLGKENYPTFTRLSYSLEKQSVCFKALLRQYKWRQMSIIYDTFDPLMRIQAIALKKSLVADPDYPRPYDIEFDTTKRPAYSAILDEVSHHARIVVFLTSGDDLRKFMLTAHDKHMTQGDYAFITIELFQSEAWGDFSWKRGDSQDADAKQAFESLLFITLTVPGGPDWMKFSREVKQRASSDYNFTYVEEVNYFVGAFYDSVIYLALALNKTLEEGGDPNDGVKVAQRLWNYTFTGIMGDVYVDEIGDRIADYTVLDMTNLEDGEYQIVGKYYGSRNSFEPDANNNIHWPGTGKPPLDTPPCGYRGNDPSCSNQKLLIVLISCVLGLLALLTAIGTFVYRRVKFESELGDMSWRVSWANVVVNRGRSMAGSTSRVSLTADVSEGSKAGLEDGNAQIFTSVGNYQGNLIAIRKIATTKFDLNRKVLFELKQMRGVHHDNLTRFVGACVETDHVAILTEYCPKGSLQDILANEAIKLDWSFRYSLINDIVRGMHYIHDNRDLKVHGRLKSSNCVVDGRFVLKITDYGLPSFYYTKDSRKQSSDNHTHAFYSHLFWRAPELLGTAGPATVEGDVYSFGIILQEVATRTDPYDDCDLSPQEIIARVGGHEVPAFRPKVDRSSCARELYDLMELCWSEDHGSRPTFTEIKSRMKSITKGAGSRNLVDNLLERMEQYAENLEVLVEERTRAFLDEKKRSEELLYRVLPRSIADQLKEGKAVQPEAYEFVTIYFSDIVGFTALSADSTPLQVVDFLNDLYTCFDAIIDKFDVYKVETIGDAYMVVSGLPIKNGNDHAREISRMALRLKDSVGSFRVRHRPDYQLKLRIGLHSGPCVAGVVGLTMPRYCLFGDTVNTASRLESNGEAGRIHVSIDTKEILDRFETFQLDSRGDIPMKGKGVMKTFWLLGERRDSRIEGASSVLI